MDEKIPDTYEAFLLEWETWHFSSTLVEKETDNGEDSTQ